MIFKKKSRPTANLPILFKFFFFIMSEREELRFSGVPTLHFFIKYQKKIWTRVQILILMILL